MRRIVVAFAFGLIAFTAICSSTANAQSSRTLSGVAIGAGTGAVIAGPIGAVAGGVIGGVVGGPSLHRGRRTCWNDRHGHQHCHWR